MKTPINQEEFVNALSHVAFGMCRDDFKKVFHGQGNYQWEKFRVEFNRDAARWIAYLDLGNRGLLFTYLDCWLEERAKDKNEKTTKI